MPDYEYLITVQREHIDAMNHVNNVVYVQWVQDAASAHWQSDAPADLLARYNWVVLRHEINYRGAAVLDDKLVAKTWVHDYEGAKSTRIVKIVRGHDEKLLVEARTTWCLLNAATNRPVRVCDEIRNVFKAEKDNTG